MRKTISAIGRRVTSYFLGGLLAAKYRDQVGRLAADGIGLAVDLLQQEIQPFAHRPAVRPLEQSAGLRQVARLCYHKAHYVAGRIDALAAYELVTSADL